MKKPVRRPQRCMIADIGVADSIEPSTMSEIGRVAKHGFDARVDPRRAPRR